MRSVSLDLKRKWAHRAMAPALGFAVLTALPVGANAAFTFEFSTGFSGVGPATGTPWLTAMVREYGSTGVNVTLNLPPTLPSGTYLDWLGLNFTGPNADALTVVATAPVVSVYKSVNNGTGNQFKADGDGYYDIVLQFSNKENERYSKGPTYYSFNIFGPGITPQSFNTLSAAGGGSGPFLAAAHIAGYGNSVWTSGVVAVPEGNFGLVVGGLGLLFALRPMRLVGKTSSKAV